MRVRAPLPRDAELAPRGERRVGDLVERALGAGRSCRARHRPHLRRRQPRCSLRGAVRHLA
eukprot:5050530-Lingulodinium_polyedra.AAC.1